MASVTMRDVRKAYGTHEVMRGVNVDIGDGEFCVLVGPSGCGKSTLLRMLAGLEDISGGTIAIGERVVNDVPPKDRDIAMVFQNYALYPHMTVRDNMAFALQLAKADKATIDQRVSEASRILGLDPYLERFPRALSGGQRQRVAMGRAIVRNPQVFLFDEPLSNLDAKLRVSMRTEIKALHQRLKTTSVYVTHDQIEAMTMADKIVVLRDGNVEQIGSPLELYDRPDNTFVASFIGSPAMNLIKGVARGGQVELNDGAMMPVEQTACRGAQMTDGQAIMFGIRPEHLTIGAGPVHIPAIIKVVEPTGADTHVICRCGESEVTVLVRDRVPHQPGERVQLVPDLPRAHVFDAASGHTLRPGARA